MATNPEVVVITVSAIDRFSEVFDLLETRLDRIRKSTQGVQNALNSLGAQLTKQVKGFVAAADVIRRGVGVIAKFAGQSVGAAKVMEQLRRSMNEANAGSRQLRAAFADLGLGVEELQSLAPDEVMLRMADAFKASESAGQKNAALLRIMGEEANFFMSAMNQGGEAYRARMAQMQADGALFSREQIAQADASEKSWLRLMDTLASVGNVLGPKLASALLPLVDILQQWVVANRGLIEQKFDLFLERLPVLLDLCQQFLTELVRSFQFSNSEFGRGVSTFIEIIDSVTGLIKAVVSLIEVLPVLAVLLKFVWAVLAENPIAIVILAVTALAMVVYNNFDAIVGYISAAWDRITSVFEIGFFDGLFQLWLEGWQGFGNTIIGLIKAITPDFLLPDSFKNFELTSATDRKKRLDSGEEKSIAQVQQEQQQEPAALERRAVMTGQKPLRGAGPPSTGDGSIFTAAQAAQAQKAGGFQAIENTIRLQIDGDGRLKVKDIASGAPNTKINVMTGPLNMGGL